MTLMTFDTAQCKGDKAHDKYVCQLNIIINAYK